MAWALSRGPGVAPLLGLCYENERRLLVAELMPSQPLWQRLFHFKREH